MQVLIKRSRRKRLQGIRNACQTLPPRPLIRAVQKKVELELERLGMKRAGTC
jgi:hypothetical protein